MKGSGDDFLLSGFLLLSAIGLVTLGGPGILAPLVPIGIIVWRITRYFRLNKEDAERITAHRIKEREYEKAKADHEAAAVAAKTAHEEPYRKERSEVLQKARSLV